MAIGAVMPGELAVSSLFCLVNSFQWVMGDFSTSDSILICSFDLFRSPIQNNASWCFHSVRIICGCTTPRTCRICLWAFHLASYCFGHHWGLFMGRRMEKTYYTRRKHPVEGVTSLFSLVSGTAFLKSLELPRRFECLLLLREPLKFTS